MKQTVKGRQKVVITLKDWLKIYAYRVFIVAFCTNYNTYGYILIANSYEAITNYKYNTSHDGGKDKMNFIIK